MGFDPASIAAYAGIASAVVGGGSAIAQATKKTPTSQSVQPVNTDVATAQADDLLRRRSRQGINANILSGSSGSGSPGTTSTGQKSLLGG